MLKTFSLISFLLFFNGCVQITSFLGPIFTGASTGSAYQAGLSYGSSKAISEITGKTTAENLIKLLEADKNKENDSENANNFFDVVKKINENSSIKNLANQ